MTGFWYKPFDHIMFFTVIVLNFERADFMVAFSSVPAVPRWF
jgi:hypothetical protein